MSGDFDFEPIPGLPAVPPEGEKILWQGSPDWQTYALQVFHARKLVVYFSILVGWYVVSSYYDGKTIADIGYGVSYFLAGSGLCVAAATGLAWGYARSSVFTITTKRIVLRHGVALPMTLNVPFSKIASVELQTDKSGTGTIAVSPLAGNRIAWLLLWPNVRPWHFSNPMPALRCIAEPQNVASLLTNAISQAEGAAVQTSTSVSTGLGGQAEPTDRQFEPKAA